MEILKYYNPCNVNLEHIYKFNYKYDISFIKSLKEIIEIIILKLCISHQQYNIIGDKCLKRNLINYFFKHSRN